MPSHDSRKWFSDLHTYTIAEVYEHIHIKIIIIIIIIIINNVHYVLSSVQNLSDFNIDYIFKI